MLCFLKSLLKVKKIALKKAKSLLKVKKMTIFVYLIMGSNKEYLIFLEDFKDKKYHKSYSIGGVDLYSYSSNKGKFGVSNILVEILLQDFTPVEVKLFLAITDRLKQSTDFEESAVVYLKYSLFSEICSDRVFGVSVKKYIEYRFLIPTPKNKYYIVSPLYINKFYKSKVEK